MGRRTPKPPQLVVTVVSRDEARQRLRTKTARFIMQLVSGDGTRHYWAVTGNPRRARQYVKQKEREGPWKVCRRWEDV